MVSYLATDTEEFGIDILYYLWGDIHCYWPRWKDTYPEVVIEISFLLVNVVMYLLPDIE